MRTQSSKCPGLLTVCLALLSMPMAVCAWEPGAKELDAAINAGEFEGYCANISAWLDKKTPVDPGKMTEAAMADLVKDPVFRNALDQRRFMETHGTTNLGVFAKTEPTQRPHPCSGLRMHQTAGEVDLAGTRG